MEDIGHFKVVIEAAVDNKTLETEFKKGNKTVVDDFEKKMQTMIEKSKAFFTKVMPASFFGKPTTLAQPGATYQSMTNRESLQPLAQSPEDKKESVFNKDSTLKTLALLTGIYYTLNNIPSILSGVLKMLGFGFLLILKPLADLLAMILLPIAKMVLDFGFFLGELSGKGMGGMIIAAIVGLILTLAGAMGGVMVAVALTKWAVAAILGTAVTSLSGAGIATAITTLATTAIGATTLVGLLGTTLIAGALTTLIVKALGGTDDDAIAAGLVAVFIAGIAVIFGAPFWAALAVGILVGVTAFFGGEALMKELEKAREIYNKSLYGPTGKPNETSINPFKGTVGVTGYAALGGPVSAGNPYIVGEMGPELFVPNTNGSIIPNNKLGLSQVMNANNGNQPINISVNGLLDKQQIESMIKSIVDQAIKTNNTRQW